MIELGYSEQLNYANLSRKKKQGLEYDIDIDRAIFHELNLSESISSGRLKTQIEKFLGRCVTPTVYYDHINKMVNENDLEKKDSGERGKQSVFYSLTKEAKREWKLNIHRLNAEHMLFRKIYERLFFYEFERTPFIISSEEEFDKLLQSEFSTTGDKLDWYRTSNARNEVIVRELYQKYSNSSTGRKLQKHHKKDMEEYWKERDGQSITFEEVVFECALLIKKTGVWIVKTEYWEINKNSKHKKYDTVYNIELPGVASKEFLNNRFVDTRNFKEKDVNRALTLLIKESLLEYYMVFRNEIRYKIADQRLRYLLESLRDFHFGEFNLLMSKWEHFNEPTEKERERTEWLLGKQESDRIFRLAEMKRHRNKLLIKTSKSLDEYHNRYLAECMVPRYVTAEYYNAYLHGEVIPNFDKSKFSISAYVRCYSDLDEYKTERRNSKKPKQDILEFHKYLRERLTLSEQSLRWDAEGLRMDNSDVLEEYKFLHNAMKIICPLVFQPAEYES